MPLRVVHVITRMIVGGAQETVLLAAALADPAVVRSVLVTGAETGPEGSLLEEARDRGVEVVLVPEMVRAVDLRRDAAVVPALTWLFRDLQADVVHTNSSKAGIVGRAAAHRAGVPRVVHTVHGWPWHDGQRAPAAALWKGLERRAARRTDRLVVVADADRAKGLAAGVGRPDQYTTVRSGLELDLYAADPDARRAVRAELGLPADAVVLGAVNRLSPQKDPLTLVQALGVVLQQRPGAVALVVGDGPLRADVEALVRRLGLEGRVVLAGLRRDVPRLLAAMDVFVTASRWEGLPRTVLQAMATGMPVVATAADGVVDVVREGETGLLVPVGDTAGLVRALLRLLDDPALGPRLAGLAAAGLPEFDAHEMVRRLEQVYAGGAP